MPSFRYSALTAGGERTAGVLAAASEQAVLAELESRRLTPVSVRETAEPRAARRRRLRGRQLAGAYSQLSDLLRAGVPLMRSLRVLAGRKSSPGLSAVFKDLADAVAEGSDLAEAMSRVEGEFPKAHVAMVRAGEKGGFLEQVLQRLGAFLENQADMRAKVVGSLIYPAVLVVAGLVVLGIVFAFFVPKFRGIFAKLEEAGTLPTITVIVLGIGDFVSRFWAVLLAAAVVAGLGIWRGSSHPAFRTWWDGFSLSIPVIGPIRRSFAVARFCRTLGTMLQNSIPLLTAMQIARDAAGSARLEDAIDKASEAVRQGQPLAGPLGESGLIEDDIVEMISVGETANNLDDVLVGVAETLEKRLDRALTAAVKLVEPLMIVLLAAAVALIALALVVPMSQLTQGIGR